MPDFIIQPSSGRVTLSSLVLGLAATSLMHLGATPHADSGETRVDLENARQSIDLLEVLREKCVGNLTPDEDKLFEAVLTDVRLRFVEMSRARR